MVSDSSTRRNISHGQNMSRSSQHVWDRVRKISGKNIYLPKQYLNGKNGTPIPDSKDIVNEHVATFTDNSPSTHYSATFQAIKEQEEVKIDFTSHSTEVCNRLLWLRDLRQSKIKARQSHLNSNFNNLFCTICNLDMVPFVHDPCDSIPYSIGEWIIAW